MLKDQNVNLNVRELSDQELERVVGGAKAKDPKDPKKDPKDPKKDPKDPKKPHVK